MTADTDVPWYQSPAIPDDCTATTLKRGALYKTLTPSGYICFRHAATNTIQSKKDAKVGIGRWDGGKFASNNRTGGLIGYTKDGTWAHVVKCRTEKEIANLKEQFKKSYPFIYEIGASVDVYDIGTPFVPRNSIRSALSQADFETFSNLFGCQTMSEHGPYPWDVEAVLVRMLTGKLTGTQLIWD